MTLKHLLPVLRRRKGARARCRRSYLMERILDAALLQPGARLLHRVAVLDAVDGDGHFDLPRMLDVVLLFS